MRISDWSSDVCSSDLCLHPVATLTWQRNMVKWFDPRSLSFPRQHRAELAAPEDVDVKVGHFLMTVLADVGEEAIAIICKPHHRGDLADPARSEEHTSELQSLMRLSYAVFCLKKKR